MKRILAIVLAVCMVFGMAACGTKQQTAEPAPATEPVKESNIDYMALVNKLNPLPEGWEDALVTVHMTNSCGDDVEVEVKAYDAYLALKEDLEKEGVYIDLDSARRTVAQQQDIMDRFIEKYGEDYAAKTVAQPGYSEHHTGLALDLYLNVDGKDVIYNEDLVTYPEIWAKIHEKLADHGFILRYLKNKEYITGYAYEPWHIRYIDSVASAHEIMDQYITLEAYVGAAKETYVKVDYGTSNDFTKEELEEAAVKVMCEFATWKGCTLYNMSYAGDENNTKENIQWLNSHADGKDYKAAVLFKTDFTTSKDVQGAWEPSHDYMGFGWWLGKTDDGWDLVDWGY